MLGDAKEAYASAVGRMTSVLSEFLQELKGMVKREKAYQYGFSAALSLGSFLVVREMRP